MSAVYQSEDEKNIVVQGAGFDIVSSWTCVFDKLHIEASRKSNYELVCTIPVHFLGFQFSFKICQNSRNYIYDSIFHAKSPVIIKNVWPLHRPLVGETKVNIASNGSLGSNSKCHFGNKTVNVFHDHEGLISS